MKKILLGLFIFGAVFCSRSFAANTIKIASFNIQIFGQSKISKEDVMNILVEIVRNFDLVAIQEIRDLSGGTMPFFKDKINEIEGPKYDYIISERVGRTSQKEQYAFLYRTDTITFSGTEYTFNDVNDNFEREPYVGNFRAGDFDFVAITIHTKPTDTPSEIVYLQNVIEGVKADFPNEDDFLILGDLNYDCSYYDETTQNFLRDTEFKWIIPDTLDTTTSATVCTYDRIIFSDGGKENYSGTGGVFEYDIIYSLGSELTKEVSDHYPVFGEFNITSDKESVPIFGVGGVILLCSSILTFGILHYK